MNSNGKKKATGGKKTAKPSFLKRLLKRDGDEKKTPRGGTGESTVSEKKKGLTPLEKSIAEIRQLQKVGERNPERLATLLGNILSKEKQNQDEEKGKFDAMVWDIVNRDENTSEENTGQDGDAGDSQNDTTAPEDEGDGQTPGDPVASPN